LTRRRPGAEDIRSELQMLLRKLSIVLVPLVLGLGSAALPGRAQESPFHPSAFADTTLLRDTLGLTFPRLFVLADSLRMLPDSLRAISIRHGLELPRLVALADSLRVPVDSVGPLLERERFNPLAARPPHQTSFSYNTTYNLQQTRNSWVNGSDYSLTRGPLFVRNVANIQMDRLESSGRTTQQQRRNATTELGWRFTPDYSLGGRAVLSRFNSNDPSTIRQIGETRDEYQVSLRTRHEPFHGVSSEFNVFSGILDLRNFRQEKRGLSTDMNGRLRHVSGEWFMHEMTGSLTGNFANTRVVTRGTRENTRDLLGNLNGTLSLFEASRVGFNGAYNLVRNRVHAPDDSGRIAPLSTSEVTLDATLRTQLGQGGYFNLSDNLDISDQITAVTGAQSHRTNTISADGRYVLWGFGLEGRFAIDGGRSELPQASPTGGYAEDMTNRMLEGGFTRQVFGRLTTRVNARIGLVTYRYRVIGSYGTPPTNRDEAQQSYRIDGTYTFSANFNSGISLNVNRNRLVNLPAASAAANYTLRSYRAEWRWTYRLLRGLTATQRNSMGANYSVYQFLPENDRLGLDYSTNTTLNAVLTPRLSADLTHNGQVQPGGNYTRSSDGLYYFRPSDEIRSFSLTSRISYTPAPGISLQVEPFFRSDERDASSGGIQSPQRRNRVLNFLGSANLNLPVAGRGTLSGNLGRTYNAERTITFASGSPTPSPRSESDFWNASLQFSWRL
jgi:hypothetical protein